MANSHTCGMCGRPILEANHVEGYHGLMKTWEPLHEKCAEILSEMARRTGQTGPVIRDGFAARGVTP